MAGERYSARMSTPVKRLKLLDAEAKAQVGHEESALTVGRTLESLYINPILDTIKRQNPTTPFVSGKTTKK